MIKMHYRNQTWVGLKAIKPVGDTPKSKHKSRVDQSKIDICLNCTKPKCKGKCEHFRKAEEV